MGFEIFGTLTGRGGIGGACFRQIRWSAEEETRVSLAHDKVEREKEIHLGRCSTRFPPYRTQKARFSAKKTRSETKRQRTELVGEAIRARSGEELTQATSLSYSPSLTRPLNRIGSESCHSQRSWMAAIWIWEWSEKRTEGTAESDGKGSTDQLEEKTRGVERVMEGRRRSRTDLRVETKLIPTSTFLESPERIRVRRPFEILAE